MGSQATTLTIAEAAAATGLTEKALRRRVERGVLPRHYGHDNRLRLPVVVLRERGLLGPERGADGAPEGSRPHEGRIGDPNALSELVGRLEHLAAENGRLKALTEVSASTEQRLTAELVETRAELTTVREQLARRRRRWWRRDDVV